MINKWERRMGKRWGLGTATSLGFRGDPVRWVTCSLDTRRPSENRNFPMSNGGAKDTISLELKRPGNTHFLLPPLSLSPTSTSIYSCHLHSCSAVSFLQREKPSPQDLKDFRTVTGSWLPFFWAVKPHTWLSLGGIGGGEDCKNDLCVTIHLPFPSDNANPVCQMATISLTGSLWDHRQFYLPKYLDFVFMVLRRLVPKC